MLKRVVIESPYAANKQFNVKQHEAYAKMALLHSLLLGEAPIASHLLHTLVLNDSDKGEREMGINAGLAWLPQAELVVFYTDLGWSVGMTFCMRLCGKNNYPTETRTLGRHAVNSIKQLRYQTA
jgi:hypothetical protein